jgi:integrase
MANIRLKHVNAFRDRHGKLRFYFRRGDGKAIPLPGLPGSVEFMDAYSVALAGDPVRFGPAKMIPGTVLATVTAYLASSAFSELAPDTKRARRSVLESFEKEHGDKRISTIQRSHVQSLVDAKRKTPGTARKLLSGLRVVLDFAIGLGMRADNPAIGVKRPKLSADGWRCWSEADIAAFEDRHPVGTSPRLALALLLYTGQRRSDAIKMGRQHIRNGAIDVRQQKTGTVLSVPIHPVLKIVIDATPSNHLTFLTTSGGKPFTPEGFGNWFRKACNEAGLPKGCSAHGLRKAACRRLAEAGCSVHQIAAISGHASLKEVERYTKAVDQASMAKDAIRAITPERKLTN